FRVIWSFTEQLCDKHEQYSALNISLTQLVPERARELNLFIDTFERERDEALALLANEQSDNNTYRRQDESRQNLVDH
ncbi:DNA repair protein, partial [Staphylococcus aureus]|nr:DNA repair protein [Staphylococcus aureus]